MKSGNARLGCAAAAVRVLLGPGSVHRLVLWVHILGARLTVTPPRLQHRKSLIGPTLGLRPLFIASGRLLARIRLQTLTFDASLSEITGGLLAFLVSGLLRFANAGLALFLSLFDPALGVRELGCLNIELCQGLSSACFSLFTGAPLGRSLVTNGGKLRLELFSQRRQLRFRSVLLFSQVTRSLDTSVRWVVRPRRRLRRSVVGGGWHRLPHKDVDHRISINFGKARIGGKADPLEAHFNVVESFGCGRVVAKPSQQPVNAT